MSANQSKDPGSNSTQPSEDEEIIDLIEELQEASTQRPPAALEEKAVESEVEELLELIEAEEEEGDNEIVWFDDLDKEMARPETLSEAVPPEAALRDAVAETTPAADSAAPAAAFQPPFPSAIGASPAVAPEALHPAALSLSEAEIEAAIERIIERRLGRSLESIIHQALEKAVSREIERLKRLLLEDDDSSARP